MTDQDFEYEVPLEPSRQARYGSMYVKRGRKESVTESNLGVSRPELVIQSKNSRDSWIF